MRALSTHERVAGSKVHKGGAVTVNAVPVCLTYPLRHGILRPHQALADCRFAGDEADDSAHFGVFEADELAGIVSVYRASCPNPPERAAWQLRGLAVRRKSRGRGFARELLQAAIGHVQGRLGSLIWCNVRAEAVDVYRKCGFDAEGRPFLIPSIGVHQRMFKRLPHEGFVRQTV